MRECDKRNFDGEPQIRNIIIMLYKGMNGPRGGSKRLRLRASSPLKWKKSSTERGEKLSREEGLVGLA